MTDNNVSHFSHVKPGEWWGKAAEFDTNDWLVNNTSGLAPSARNVGCVEAITEQMGEMKITFKYPYQTSFYC